jgi:glutathione S-transferase
MRLLSSPTSPYARKVRMAVIEAGLADRIELEPGVPMGTAEEAAAVRQVNPLGKIPALVLDTGEALYDSPVICEYLDSLGSGHRLLAADGPLRWTALRRQALGDGVADAAFNIVMEHRRPEAQRSTEWLDRWTLAIHGAADALEAELAAGPLDTDLGAVAIAAAFAYVDFRLPRIAWRVGRPHLTAAFTDLAARPSFIATAPPRG